MKKTTLRLIVVSMACLGILAGTRVLADDPPKTPEDMEREALIEQFTKKMKESNWPAMFEKVGKEFNVPSDILMAISFAETRWEHLQWPEGETHSPDNGMPRPFGIMSLWENDHFGYTLHEAAKLIGKTPEELKKDPLENMRGAAALLRKKYEETPKPADFSAEDRIESWRYAIAEYCGIPDRDLKHQHAFDVYDWLYQGYNQYGIEMPEHPELKPSLDIMWKEVKQIREEEDAKRQAKYKEMGLEDGPLPMAPEDLARLAEQEGKAAPVEDKTPSVAPTKAEPPPVVATNATATSSNWMLWVIVFVGAALVGFLLLRKKEPEAPKK